MFTTTFVLPTFSQGEEMTMMTSHSDSVETITSYKDALIKAPLLVSQQKWDFSSCPPFVSGNPRIAMYTFSLIMFFVYIVKE
jgi:hypothetical protein